MVTKPESLTKPHAFVIFLAQFRKGHRSAVRSAFKQRTLHGGRADFMPYALPVQLSQRRRTRTRGWKSMGTELASPLKILDQAQTAHYGVFGIFWYLRRVIRSTRRKWQVGETYACPVRSTHPPSTTPATPPSGTSFSPRRVIAICLLSTFARPVESIVHYLQTRSLRRVISDTTPPINAQEKR